MQCWQLYGQVVVRASLQFVTINIIKTRDARHIGSPYTYHWQIVTIVIVAITEFRLISSYVWWCRAWVVDRTPLWSQFWMEFFLLCLLSSPLLYVSVCMRAGLSSPCTHTHTYTYSRVTSEQRTQRREWNRLLSYISLKLTAAMLVTHKGNKIRQ